MSILFTAHEIKQVDKGLISRIYGPIKQRQTKKVKRFNRQFIEGILGDKHEKLLNICNEQLQTKTIRSPIHLNDRTMAQGRREGRAGPGYFSCRE